MTRHVPSYHGYRFPPEITSHAVWLYHRFCLSFRDAKDLLAHWRGPSAGIPGAECFESDTKSRRALRLGQAEPRPDLPQRRYRASHRSLTMPLVRRWLEANGRR